MANKPINLNKPLKVKYNLVSKLYDLLDCPFEIFRYKKIRQTVWKSCTGRILDAGIGTGRNIPFYPKNSKVYGIDISEGMIAKASKRAEKLNRKVKISKYDMIHTNFPDNFFDTVVATFLFCVMPDKLKQKALKEIKRICKTNGKIILLEYEYSKKTVRKLFMKFLTPYVDFMYGARFDRRTIEAIRNEKLKIVYDKYVYQDIIRMIVLKP